jgi:NADH:ubiquinone oxidoreductase subunit K
VESTPDRENPPKRKPTVGDLNRFLAALEYTPEEINALSLGKVFEEIGSLGEDYGAIRENLEHQIKIVRGRVDSVAVYEVTESELSILENGPPSSIYLNFSIFLLSVAVSFLITLLTTKIESDRVFTIFVVVTAIGFIAGLLLLLIWYRSHRSLADIIQTIKKRIPND